MLKKPLILIAFALFISLYLPSIGQAEEQSSIGDVIKQLQNPDIAVRESGLLMLEALSEEGLPLEEGLQALEAATQSFPNLADEWEDASAALIRATWQKPFHEYISAVVKYYDSYNSEAKAEAFGLLSMIADREAAVAMMEIFRKHAKNADQTYLSLSNIAQNPRFLEVFFPEILDYIIIPQLEQEILYFLYSTVQSGILTSKHISGKENLLKTRYAELKATVHTFEKDEDLEWIWNDQYYPSRNLTGLYLDIFGYLNIRNFETILRDALNFKDPRLVHFAALSLLRQNKKVDAKYINQIAENSEMRKWLFQDLAGLKKIGLFPKKYKNQEALAESDMVNWLIYPTELGRTPGEIQLMEVISVETESNHGIVDFYIFKFTEYQTAQDTPAEWMAGVSGYFIRKEEPTTESWGYTFSSFEPWDVKTPEEHLIHIIETLNPQTENE